MLSRSATRTAFALSALCALVLTLVTRLRDTAAVTSTLSLHTAPNTGSVGSSDADLSARSPPAYPDSAVAVDLSRLAAVLTQLDAIALANGTTRMGNSGSRGYAAFLQLTDALRAHAPRGATRLCELGFNVGHSAALILAALPSVRSYVGFDTARRPELYAGLALLRAIVPAVAFELVEGMTAVGVPTWLAAGGRGTCDVVHIDANHDLPNVRGDATLALEMVAGPGSLLVFDDCGCIDPPREAHWCVGPTIAFDELVAAGDVRVATQGVIAARTRGTCMGVVMKRRTGP